MGGKRNVLVIPDFTPIYYPYVILLELHHLSQGLIDSNQLEILTQSKTTCQEITSKSLVRSNS
jgi:hypothetical protein